MTDDTDSDIEATARDSDSDGESIARDSDGDRESTTRDADSDDESTTREDDVGDRMRAALRDVRREGWKAAIVHAVVDAAALALTANLLLSVLDPARLPDSVAVPASVAEAAGYAGATLPTTAVVAAPVGLLAFVGETWYRTRRPLVERFEAVNPPVAEALRTARDAVADGADSRMARRLYGDVLAGLQESSSYGLVDARRVGVALAVVLVVSALTVQAAVVDLSLVGAGPAAAGADGPSETNYTGLRDGSEVLGEPGEVAVGNDTQEARVESTGGGQEVDGEQFPEVGGGGPATGDGGSVEGQQAGFTDPEAVEDADLVREYNQRIRENENEDAGENAPDDE
jgi:hypothetical protein